MSSVLIVEDDKDIRDIVLKYLKVEGFNAFEASSIRELNNIMKKVKIDVIILDLMLPDGDALDAIADLRTQNEGIGIIVLSARHLDKDKIYAIEAGADDYVTKPFNPRELVARVRSLLRRLRKESELYDYGELKIYPDNFLVELKGKKLDLSTKEFEILKTLAMNPGKVYTRNQLLDMIWSDDDFVSDRVVDVHISMIRSKIGKDWIRTIRGIGYCFVKEKGKVDQT